MGDLSINDEMKSAPENAKKVNIPKNNVIFNISNITFNKLEDIENDSKIRNFIEIGDKFYALEDVLIDDFELVEDAIPNNDTTKEKKYFISTSGNGKHLIINQEGQDIIIDAKHNNNQQTYEKFTEKYKIYDKDIMKDMKLFEKQLQKKKIYKILFIISILIILLLLMYVIYNSCCKKPKVVTEETNDVNNDEDNDIDNNTNNNDNDIDLINK